MEQTLEIRSVEIRSADLAERTISGLAVPYNQVTNVGGYKERFEKGAFGDATDVLLFSKHQEEIGLVTKGWDTDEGYMIEARISETPEGNRVYTLLKDKVLKRFSVGFMPVEHRMEDDVVVRTKAALKEVSVVAFPAYEGAKISEVRNDSQTINNTKEDIDMSNEVFESRLADLEGRNEDLERRLAMIGEAKVENKVQVRQGGEFLKALHAKDRQVRDFVGLADQGSAAATAWVTERMRLQAEGRPLVNLFSKGALPSEGMTVSYQRVAGTSGTVGVHTEGADLPWMGVAFTSETADVKTYGGYTSLSREVIERGSVPALETALEHMVRQYAKATEKAVRDALVAGTGYNTATIAADADSADWIDLIVDSTDLINDNSKGSTAEFILVSSDVYKSLAHMVDGQGRPLFSIAGQSVNSLGTANIVASTLNVAGLPVVKNTALAAGTVYVAGSDALKVWESAGAPFRLQDENIINLTKDFSLYGYMAVGITNPLAVVDVTVTA